MNKRKKLTYLFVVVLVVAIVIAVFAAVSSNNNNKKSWNNIRKELKTTSFELLDKDKLIVGIAPQYIPYEYYEDYEFVGYDVDISNMLAQSLGLETEFVYVTFDSIFDGFESPQKYDIAISALRPSIDRKSIVNFTKPYCYIKDIDSVLIANKNAPINKEIDEKGYHEIKGKFSISENSMYESFVNEHFKDVELDIRLDDDKCLGAVNNGESMYSIVPASVYENSDERMSSNVVVLNRTKINDNLCIAVPYGKDGLLDVINEILYNRFNDNSIEEIRTKYFPN